MGKFDTSQEKVQGAGEKNGSRKGGRMIRVICDRCGKEIEVPGKTGYLAWNFRAGHGGAGSVAVQDRAEGDKM